MKREFAVIPSDGRLLWLLPGVSAAAALVAIAYAATVQQQPRLWLVLPVALAALALFACLLRRARVTLDSGTLVIAAGLLTKRVAVADLDPAVARIVDLRERNELRPYIRMFGIRLPGHSSGFFWLRDRRVAFVLVTDRARVLLLPQKSGKALLLSLQQPQALLDALAGHGR